MYTYHMMYSYMLLLSKDVANGFPKTCQEVHKLGDHDGYYHLDPEQDGFDPILVYCNISTTPVTAVLHHNREEWTHVHGYNAAGSYDGQVGSVTRIW